MSQVRRTTRSRQSLLKKVERIRSGYSLRDLEGAAKQIEVPVQVVRDMVGMHSRAFSRRVQSKAPLNKPESDALYRLLRIHQVAVEALGDARKANAWLQQPSIALEDQIPLSLLDTDLGSHAVEEALRKVQYGIFL